MTTKPVAVITGLIVLLAGIVQNTSFSPAEKSTSASELVDDMTVSLDKVSGVASVTVPIPTSNSSDPELVKEGAWLLS